MRKVRSPIQRMQQIYPVFFGTCLPACLRSCGCSTWLVGLLMDEGQANEVGNYGRRAVCSCFFLISTMREGARAHEMDDSAASKMDSAQIRSQSINQLINQPINQPANQPTNQPINQSEMVGTSRRGISTAKPAVLSLA